MTLDVELIRPGTLIVSRALVLKHAGPAMLWNAEPYPIKTFLVVRHVVGYDEDHRASSFGCLGGIVLIVSNDQFNDVIDVRY